MVPKKHVRQNVLSASPQIKGCISTSSKDQSHHKPHTDGHKRGICFDRHQVVYPSTITQVTQTDVYGHGYAITKDLACRTKAIKGNGMC